MTASEAKSIVAAARRSGKRLTNANLTDSDLGCADLRCACQGAPTCPRNRRWANLEGADLNEKIAKQVLIEKGDVDSPLWEAICAMGLMSEGISPAWTLTPKAQVYYNAAYDTFIDWKKRYSSKGSLEVAKRLYDILKQVDLEECKA